MKNKEVVGHIPRCLSKYCTSALSCGGTVECLVLKKRENKRGNGLKVPCKYIVSGPKYMLTNIECLIKDYLKRINFRVYVQFRFKAESVLN